MREHARAIHKALDNIEDWNFGKHTANHVPSGLELWTANTFFNFHVWSGANVKFNIWEKFILSSKIQCQTRKKLARSLNETTS